MDQSVPKRRAAAKAADKAKPKTGSGRLTAEESARLPDRLLDAAEQLFGEHGYAKTTMDGIAKLAGASTKTVYERYRNKNEILAAILRRANDNAIAPLFTELNEKIGDIEPRAFLVHAGLRIATRVASDNARMMYRLVVSECPRYPELSDLYKEGSGRFLGMLADKFKHWDKTGALPLRIKPDAAAQTFLDLVAATPRNRAMLDIPLTARQRAEHVDAAVELFVFGCQKR